MPQHSYHEHDYVFGQVMLKLRTSIGLTLAGLAERLGVSRRAVGEWEGGLNYPKAERLQQLIALCVRQHVFAPEREEEEIRALWKTASPGQTATSGSRPSPAPSHVSPQRCRNAVHAAARP